MSEFVVSNLGVCQPQAITLGARRKAGLSLQSVRVLVVEDYEPFRRFVVSLLQGRPEVRIISEASDGLSGVQKAQELRPDLILLDIGLPTLNGIEAGRRIRKVSPESKILFLSQESSADVVQEALGLGASGYVMKTQAASELSTAMETVLRGNQFVSSALGTFSHQLQQPGPRTTDVCRGHAVEFYLDDTSFVDGFVSFIEPALRSGNAAIVVATNSRREAIHHRLREREVDISAASAEGRYASIDVAELLSTFMVDDVVDPVRFLGVAGDLILASARATAMKHPRVVACGECASILWTQGKADAAFEVEHLCNQLAERHNVNILCGFQLSSFCREEDQQMFERICRKA
ncbi:MAG TPA: response regulator [Candidatus Sulfotelmatobacter sp.]|jgi:DNA-binding NarL/FixJ family response regulator|nr:response regulator [Candidatus Sulfotelmatobacter sp.]